MKTQKKKIRKCEIWLFLTALLLMLAAVSSLIVPQDPYSQDLGAALQAPGAGHLFGTDRYGRDLFARVLVGGRTTIYASLCTVLLITGIGTILGVISGYLRGKTDTVLMRIADVFLAFPGIVFAIAVAGVLGGGLFNAVIALVCVSWPKYARLARSQVLAMKEMPYLQAAKLSGRGNLKIMGKHILPNIAGPILVTAVLDIGTMIMEIAGLSYLGLGAKPPVPEWGSMMSEGRSMLQTAPWTILTPGLGIFVTVVVFHLLGDALRDVLDPKERKNTDENDR